MSLSPTDSTKVVAFIEDGNSQRYVAAVLGIPRSTVERVYHRFRETGCYSRRPGSVRKRVTSARDDHFIFLNTLRDRHSTAVETRRAFQKIKQVNVSKRTVRRRLDECGLNSRRPAKGPELIRQHRVERLRFAHNHTNWNLVELRRVLFTDESRFSLQMDVKEYGEEKENLFLHVQLSKKKKKKKKVAALVNSEYFLSPLRVTEMSHDACAFRRTKESIIRAVLHLGFSASEAGRRFIVSERTAQRWVQNYQRSTIFGRKAGSGRRKISTPQQDARLVAELERNPYHTGATLKAVNFPGHDQTMRNRLRAANLRSRRAIHREVHKEEHVEKRLVFAVGNGDRDWKTQDNHPVHTSQLIRDWFARRQDIELIDWPRRFPDLNPLENMWAKVKKHMRKNWPNPPPRRPVYIEEIPIEHVPYAPLIGEKFLLMHDNARPHATRIVDEFLHDVGLNRIAWPARSRDINPIEHVWVLHDVGLNRMAWPARSPDIFPIEHVWGLLGKRGRSRPTPYSNLQHLRNFLINEWNRIDPTDIQNLIEGLNRRTRHDLELRDPAMAVENEKKSQCWIIVPPPSAENSNPYPGSLHPKPQTR
ncbi:hypothetical protein ANN_17604 [Periplaneta americana]|uniref:Transposase n=1 Tax=Periplaneta americana TaxID=6978 RepID=A0ABQ8SVI7_PERAM|nr:hypothetical protein ANN_17604 [Periplaneta americana]